MKKIMTLLCAMVIATGAGFAQYTEQNVSNIETLRNQGFSEAALRIIDTAKAHNQGAKYQRHFVEKDSTGKLGKPYTALKVYVDPMQEDNAFGEHEINFTNTWNGDETPYSLRSRDRETENL